MRRRNPLPDGVFLFGAMALTSLGMVLLIDAMKARAKEKASTYPAVHAPSDWGYV